MTKIEILEYLELMQGEITDIQHRSDDTGDSENRSSADTLEELVNELRFNIENDITISDKEEHDFNEAINGELMGPDRLPLNYPYHNDGEGRLKGNN